MKGVLPKYEPPQAVESMIDDKLNPTLTMNLIHQNTNKNYMLDNIKRSKASPSRQKKGRDNSPESRIISVIEKSEMKN